MQPLSPPASPQRGARPAARQQEAHGVSVPPTLLQRALTDTWRRENAEVRAPLVARRRCQLAVARAAELRARSSSTAAHA
jgi:hypothetical protein